MSICKEDEKSLENYLPPPYNAAGKATTTGPQGHDSMGKVKHVKIVNILGSPRKNGTSGRIARAFADTAAAYGATVIDYQLNQMQYRG